MRANIQIKAPVVAPEAQTEDLGTFKDYYEALMMESQADREVRLEQVRVPLDRLYATGELVGPCKLTRLKGNRYRVQCPQWGKLRAGDTALVRLKGERLHPRDIPDRKVQLKPTPDGRGFSVPNKVDKWLHRGFFLMKYSDWDDMHFRKLLRRRYLEAWPRLAVSGPRSADIPAWAQSALNNQRAREILKRLLGGNPVYGVKGPPGTGKTFLLACAAIALAEQGKRVILSAVSHAAVNNALEAVRERRDDLGLSLVIARKGSDVKAKMDGIPNLKEVTDWSILGVTLAGLAVWKAGMKTEDEPLGDILILDEAGQIPVFKAAAVVDGFTSLLAFGDDDQLEPIFTAQQDVNKEMDQSLLGFLSGNELGRQYTDHLNETFRLNESLCDLIDRYFYKSLGLRASRNAQSQVLWAKGDPRAGKSLCFVPVAHRNNVEVSLEEVSACKFLVDDLLRTQISMDGKAPRPLEPKDILILAPYRWQVDRLSAAIPEVSVGTVDSMQGQSVGVVIYSMTTSCLHTLGMRADWFLNLNRWNVALSRAKAQAYVVGRDVWGEEVVCKTYKGWDQWITISRMMREVS